MRELHALHSCLIERHCIHEVNTVPVNSEWQRHCLQKQIIQALVSCEIIIFLKTHNITANQIM